jgi:hypothetical protein
MEYNLIIESPRPYFAELPHYLWGAVNYNSEGDCKYPTDTEWTCLELMHRNTREQLEITCEGDKWKVSGDDPIAARATKFLAARCFSKEVHPLPDERVELWQHEKALARARRVASEFSSPKLKIFDSHLFWGCWKWIGWFATDCTWVGRWIMVSVLKSDRRGVPLCINWLQQGTFNADQSKALRDALQELTGECFGTDAEWIKWYRGSLFRKGAKVRYPEPNIAEWLEELKKEYGDSQPDGVPDTDKPGH